MKPARPTMPWADCINIHCQHRFRRIRSLPSLPIEAFNHDAVALWSSTTFCTWTSASFCQTRSPGDGVRRREPAIIESTTFYTVSFCRPAGSLSRAGDLINPSTNHIYLETELATWVRIGLWDVYACSHAVREGRCQQRTWKKNRRVGQTGVGRKAERKHTFGGLKAYLRATDHTSSNIISRDFEWKNKGSSFGVDKLFWDKKNWSTCITMHSGFFSNFNRYNKSRVWHRYHYMHFMERRNRIKKIFWWKLFLNGNGG
jgi:hypothetical protein